MRNNGNDNHDDCGMVNDSLTKYDSLRNICNKVNKERFIHHS